VNRKASKLILERAQQQGTPLVDGESVTFVWRGSRPPRLLSDMNDWDEAQAPLLAAAGPGTWLHSLRLPRDAYLEYAYLLDGERMPDPLNPRSTPNGLGQVNSTLYMPEAAPTPLAQRRRAVPHGRVTRHTAETGGLAIGKSRRVTLYQPPGAEPCPLLVVLDGQDYYRRARLPNMMDNLIAEGRMRPVALALVDHAGPGRVVEYGCCEAVSHFFLAQVLPLARRELNLVDVDAHAGAYGVCGASMGGLMALYMAMRAPRVFGQVLVRVDGFWLGHHGIGCRIIVRRKKYASRNGSSSAGIFVSGCRLIRIIRGTGSEIRRYCTKPNVRPYRCDL
jgi:enterochelin esterase family protein